MTRTEPWLLAVPVAIPRELFCPLSVIEPRLVKVVPGPPMKLLLWRLSLAVMEPRLVMEAPLPRS